MTWTLLQGDSAEVLKTLDADSIDLTVTSPPYDNLRTYKGFTFDFETIAQELYRVTKPGGVVVWVVGDATVDGSETGTSFEQALYLKRIGFKLHDTMIYEKNGPSHPDNLRYQQVFEYMFVLSKGKPKTINLIADRKNRWAGCSNFGTRTNRSQKGELEEGGTRLAGRTIKEYGIRWNVWEINTGFGYSASDNTAYSHPAIFPEKLAHDHIVSWSNPGDTIFDPFAGSGTTLKMAEQLGRDSIGIEISGEYCEIIRRRMSNLQQTIFNL